MESSSFECSICKLSIHGCSNYQRHVNSIEHATRVQMSTSSNVTDEEKVVTPAENEVTSSLNLYPQSVSSYLGGLACDLCQKRFTGKEPYEQHLESAGHKKKLGNLSNANNPLGQLRCDICDKDFSGIVPYEQHIVSKVHLKKKLQNDVKQNPLSAFFTEYQLGGLNKANDSYCEGVNETNNSNCKEVKTLGSDTIDASNSNPNCKCSSCGESFSNYLMYNQHMKINHFDDPEAKINNSEPTITASFVASHLLFSCDVCDKKFSGPVPYQQHMESPVHMKKVQQKEMLKGYQSLSNRCVGSESNSNKMEGIVSNTLQPSSSGNSFLNFPSKTPSPSPFRCEDCDKNFTGPVPYDQHINSAIHLKKILQKNPMSGGAYPASSSPISVIPNSERYFCKICDKQCSGSVPFAQHNLSEAHCRKVQMLNFQQELNNLSKQEKLKNDKISTVNSCSTETNLFSSSELSFSDVLKEVNYFIPDTVNVTTFKAGDNIVF